MSSNFSDHKHAHISVDSYTTIKPIGHSQNEYEGRDLGNLFVELEPEKWQTPKNHNPAHPFDQDPRVIRWLRGLPFPEEFCWWSSLG